jgi:gamma-glutamylputrescine oxidase
MINQNLWFSPLLIKQLKYRPPLSKSIKRDVLIVGGGFSGVSAAAEFPQRIQRRPMTDEF